MGLIYTLSIVENIYAAHIIIFDVIIVICPVIVCFKLYRAGQHPIPTAALSKDILFFEDAELVYQQIYYKVTRGNSVTLGYSVRQFLINHFKSLSSKQKKQPRIQNV